MTTEDIRIYVACLASYNNGRLYGRWIDATNGADDIWAEIREMLAESPMPGAEEWAIHDFEGFRGIRLSEYESIERVAEMAAAIEEHGVAFAAYVNYVGGDPDVSQFEESYRGSWESEEAFAEHEIEQTGWADVPPGEITLGHNGYREIKVNPIESLLPYLDMEMIARDLFSGSYFSADADGETHVFESH